MRNREYLSYFNLSQDPFSREIGVEKLLMLPSVERSLAAAELLVETHGIGVMTGRSGTGKSCLLRLLIDRLQPGLYKSYYVCHTSVRYRRVLYASLRRIRSRSGSSQSVDVSRD